MTPDEIIAMAKEAGIDLEPQRALSGETILFTDGSLSIGRLERLVALVAAKEREACAQACEWLAFRSDKPLHNEADCAATIRARGQKDAA